MVSVYVFCLCVFFSVAHSRNFGGLCKTPSGESAKCISVYQCDWVMALLQSPTRTQEQTEFLVSSKCGLSSTGTPLVCCDLGFRKAASSVGVNEENYIPNPSMPSKNECGWQASHSIFHGKAFEATALDEFPWTVVIQYLEPNGDRRTYCAGSLINRRYIVTAAQCVTGNVLKIGQPNNIRFGEYNITSLGRDCLHQNGQNFCNQPELDVGIEELIPHPNFTGHRNRLHDIALIRLDKNVQYTDYVQPICLPELSYEAATGDQLIVAGWGKTVEGSNSDIKLKGLVFKTDLEQCHKTGLFNLTSTSHLCAGDKDGKDICIGKSGSPLMRQLPTDQARYMLEGLVSFGYYKCGTAGYPGVYTKVAKYVPWIHKTIRSDFSTNGVLSSLRGNDATTTPTNIPIDVRKLNPNPAIPSRSACGLQARNRILNGEVAAIDEFPWMAAMEYRKPNGTMGVNCAASLINQRYVITAAHCVCNLSTLALVNIRLGEYNISSPGQDSYCQNGEMVYNNPEINIGIEKIIPYPDYKHGIGKPHDIALIRLDRNVQYSVFVQPICLPEPTDAIMTGEPLIVAGWGTTENGNSSDVQIRLQMFEQNIDKCASVYDRMIGYTMTDNQLCAGGKHREDTCKGDSGGPLMSSLPTDNSRIMLRGVVSFGWGCGIEGYPGVYTRVAKYVQWIHNTVKP